MALNLLRIKSKLDYRVKWRQTLISQAQSVNLFLLTDVHKELHKIHFDAWKKGLKAFITVDQNQSKELKTSMMLNRLMLQLMFISLKINNRRSTRV